MFGILNLIWIWSMVFDTTMIQILALSLDLEDAKIINLPLVLNSGFSEVEGS